MQKRLTFISVSRGRARISGQVLSVGGQITDKAMGVTPSLDYPVRCGVKVGERGGENRCCSS